MERKKKSSRVHRMQQCWGECLETLGLSEAESFQIARVPSAPSFLHLKHNHIYKLLQSFNLSQELLDEGKVCRKTLIRQFRGDVAFSRRALGNRGSRPELILKLGSYLKKEYEFEKILASFQLSKKLLVQAKTYLSAEIVDVLAAKICDNRGSFSWVKSSSVDNYRQCFGNTRGDAKSFIDLVENQIKLIEKNFSYKIEKLSGREITFSCKTNEKTRHYLGRNLEHGAWPLNIKYFCQCYFGDCAEVRTTHRTLDGHPVNRFEVTFF